MLLLNREWLIDVMHRPTLSITDRLLAVLLDPDAPEKTHNEIEMICIEHGIKKPSNTRTLLSQARSQGKVALLGDKWKLLDNGRGHLEKQGIVLPSPSVLFKARDDIRKYLPNITNPDTQAFVEETIRCLEGRLFRSAVVMAWVGAVDILHDFVANNVLAAFNAEASKHDKDWKTAINVNGLSRISESKFLDVLQSINVIDHSTKIMLQKCLDERNACGHPSNYQIGEQSVAAHIEKLIQNVYAKF